MKENRLYINPNSEENILETLRLITFQISGMYPDSHAEYFELRTIGKEESDRIKLRLKNWPGLKEALSVQKDRDHPQDRIFRINKEKFQQVFHDTLRNSMDVKDANKAWSRLETLDYMTKRSWSQQQSPLYAEEVVQLFQADKEPASREVQVHEMAHQLLGDSESAVAETKDWLRHVSDSEQKYNHPARTSVPSTWVTRKSVGEMANRLNFSDKEKERLRRVFELE